MEVSWNVTNISRLLLVANSAMNPVIYALWKNDINKEIKKLLRREPQLPNSSLVTFRSGNEGLSSQGTPECGFEFQRRKQNRN
jgi:hypothetical protein